MDIKPTARVTLVTTKGNIDIELFPKELPQSCREFLSNCINKKYVGLEFAKITPSLIQSSQLENSPDIKQEKNPRIKFNSRGAVGLLRVEGTRFSSASGFFISLEHVTTYTSDYVFIGNVVGESIYNVVKIKDSELKPGTESPLYTVNITDCIVSESYFNDLEKRTITTENKKRKKPRTTVKLDYEDEDDTETTDAATFVVRSAHELLSDRNSIKPKDLKPPVEIDPKSIKPDDEKTDENKIESKDEAQKESQLLLSTTDTHENDKSEIDEKSEASLPVKPPLEGKIVAPQRQKTTRDSSIDPYDPELDFSEDEITYETLRKHKFICR
ncbi:hypothetical protein JCM33374_g2784 [Metschnikowia sp. JCM 33374]|nr:hypothetical protein JCM33374_g2784 [Metschnikowia sp. JCM 33374]